MFSALTRLDQNRAAFQLANKAGVHVSNVKKVAIWGNHSATQYPDAENAKINGQPVFDVISDHDWLRDGFISNVQKRGAEIIAARGKSSAMSAAVAVVDQMNSFKDKTEEGNWFSAAVASDGSYGIKPGIIFSFPCVCSGGDYQIVQGLEIDDFSREKIDATVADLGDVEGAAPGLCERHDRQCLMVTGETLPVLGIVPGGLLDDRQAAADGVVNRRRRRFVGNGEPARRRPLPPGGDPGGPRRPVPDHRAPSLSRASVRAGCRFVPGRVPE